MNHGHSAIITMKRKLILGFALGLLLALPSLGRVHDLPRGPIAARADSLIEAAHLTHDFERIIVLADSLEATGDFSRIKADYWRGYGYYSTLDQHLCQVNWSEALNLEIRDRVDLEFYGRSANRLSDFMLAKGDFDAAMRVATPALEKLREGGMTSSRDYGYLLITVGCSELNNRDREQAHIYFEEANQLFTSLLADHGPAYEDNLKSAVAGFTTIARHCLDEKYYAEAIIWADRLDNVMEDYSSRPETFPESADRRQTLSLLFRAAALEGLGERKAAAVAYDEALRHAYSRTDPGRVEATRYLMLAGRWKEAAENFRHLDNYLASYGPGPTLENIRLYLLPKYRANYNAHRSEEALATGLQLCEALDSAIVWNREDMAAELATIFQTQQMKQDFTEQRARLERVRFRSAVAMIVLLIVFFLSFIIIRQRSANRLEEAYQQLEQAHELAQEASRVKTAFLQQISHEIRTPVNLLSGFAQLLTTPGMELDEQSRAEINRGVVENTGRITGLVGKILELSDLISRSEMEKNDRITAMELAMEAVVQCGITKLEKIHFELQAPEDVRNQTLVTNERAAMRILGLLLENAVKFTEEGSVCLRMVPKPGFVHYLVEDNGIGVPPEDAERIFDHFVQLDDYREGTGIGLSLARSLARRLGGEVTLDTSYAPGARFVFSLPLGE